MSSPTLPLVCSSKLIQVAGADPISLTILGLPKSIREQTERYNANANGNYSNGEEPLVLTTWPKAMVNSIRADESMEKALHRNLDSKSIILSRLMHEANEQAKELATTAEEMSSLRNENKAFAAQVAHLQGMHADTRKVHTSRKEDMKLRQKEAADAAKVARGSEEKHTAQIKGLQAGIVEAQIKQKEMLREAQKLNQLIRDNPALPRRTAWGKRMEGAIRVQQLYIERMKKENAEIESLSERAERTERIILLLEKKLYAANSGDESTIAMHPRVKYRIRDLQEQVVAAADRERALHMVFSGEDDGLVQKMNRSVLLDGKPLASKIEEGTEAESGDDLAAALHAMPPNKSVVAYKTRCKTLQEQLINNAKSFAGELSKVKLDLMQAELGGSDSDEDED